MKNMINSNNPTQNQLSVPKLSNQKKMFNIQTSSQLKSYLLNENVFSLKIILYFIFSAMRNFPKNLSLFYEILLQLIEKINITVDNQSIKYDSNDKNIIITFLSEYQFDIEIINKQFDFIFSDELINYYLYSVSKHNITIFIFCIMTTFTYIAFDINKSRSSKKEVYHILQKVRNKYICNDMNRILCPGCSLNCITKMLVYINRFITNKNEDNVSIKVSQEEDMKNKEDLLSKLNMLNGKVTVIRAGIDQLEKLIQDEKNNSERVMKEMKELLIHLK